MESKFELGQLVTTAGVHEKMAVDNNFATFVWTSLGRYIRGDWGDTVRSDAKLNDNAVATGERILAVYTRQGVTIWIITEWDRSVTTVLFPDEY